MTFVIMQSFWGDYCPNQLADLPEDVAQKLIEAGGAKAVCVPQPVDEAAVVEAVPEESQQQPNNCDVSELGLSKGVLEKLVLSGINTASEVVEMGKEGLMAIEGIGSAQAKKVLEAAKGALGC